MYWKWTCSSIIKSNDKSDLQRCTAVHWMASGLGHIALLDDQLHCVYQFHERVFWQFGHKPADGFAGDRFFTVRRGLGSPSVDDTQAFDYRECSWRGGDLLFSVVLFSVQAVQEHGIFASVGSVQVTGHSVLQHSGVQHGKKARGAAEDLCSDEDQLLGDFGGTYYGVHILRPGQLPDQDWVLWLVGPQSQPVLSRLVALLHVYICIERRIAIHLRHLLQFCTPVDSSLRWHYWSQLHLRRILYLKLRPWSASIYSLPLSPFPSLSNRCT